MFCACPAHSLACLRLSLWSQSSGPIRPELFSSRQSERTSHASFSISQLELSLRDIRARNLPPLDSRQVGGDESAQVCPLSSMQRVFFFVRHGAPTATVCSHLRHTLNFGFALLLQRSRMARMLPRRPIASAGSVCGSSPTAGFLDVRHGADGLGRQGWSLGGEQREGCWGCGQGFQCAGCHPRSGLCPPRRFGASQPYPS
jgi:hypothetical protein